MILTKNDIDEFQNIVKKYDKVILLTDDNARRCCLPLFSDLVDTNNYVVVTISHGETNKNLKTVSKVLKKLIENNASRHSLMINLGGGLVTDIGGFIASIFLRGVNFVNVPTTLLAMTDAAIGGKTGVDFMNYKNLVGSFAEPQAILIINDFLMTLPKRELLSGMVEMIKYGFVIDKKMLDLSKDNYTDFIMPAVFMKQSIVDLDKRDDSARKILNFGHTVGHAIESYFVEDENCLSHGECVALGMYCSLWLSVKLIGLNKEILKQYRQIYNKFFNKLIVNDMDIDRLMSIMTHDKKNHDGEYRFVLLKGMQKPVIDVMVSFDEAKNAVDAMLKWQKTCLNDK